MNAQDYIDTYKLESIFDLDLLENNSKYDRLALPDGENSIWVCCECGELADPDDGCECYEEFEYDPDEY